MSFKPSRVAIAVAIAAGMLSLLSGERAQAESRLYENIRYSRHSTTQGSPLLAVVGLREQRISIYDATGARMLEAPVSSGAKGYETPAGVYSIVQKEEDHRSNLYDDASMPYMERITWTGMALHAGDLPGFPASHGCVRLPLDFAERLYMRTDLGMRVVVAREDIAPVAVPQPALFSSGAAPKMDASGLHLANLRSASNIKSGEAERATERDRDLRQAASRRAAEATSAVQALRRAEAGLARAEADLKAAETVREKADTPAKTAKAEEARTKAAARAEAARTQLQTARADADAKAEAAPRAQAEARAAAAAMNAAVEAAEQAKQDMSPVSVLISRKTHRLYIRKNNYPVFEAPVLIRDADKPLGTFVFTALGPSEGTGEMRWNAVSMYKDPTNIEPYSEARHGHVKGKPADPAPATDAAAARRALDRLDIPQEAIDRASAVVLPGSSLIVSDEGPSVETGKDTDFVVFMSGEPQGGVAIRRHAPVNRDDWDDEEASVWPFSRGRRSSGRGFGALFDD